MAKYFGLIGYVSTIETSPGIWEEQIINREYYGDVVRYSSNYSKGLSINDNVLLSIELSVIADSFAFDNIYNIKYATFGGAKWKVESITPEYPRLRLTLGGLYNEN